jgi:hypothetical protein
MRSCSAPRSAAAEPPSDDDRCAAPPIRTCPSRVGGAFWHVGAPRRFGTTAAALLVDPGGPPSRVYPTLVNSTLQSSYHGGSVYLHFVCLLALCCSPRRFTPPSLPEDDQAAPSSSPRGGVGGVPRQGDGGARAGVARTLARDLRHHGLIAGLLVAALLASGAWRARALHGLPTMASCTMSGVQRPARSGSGEAHASVTPGPDFASTLGVP